MITKFKIYESFDNELDADEPEEAWMISIDEYEVSLFKIGVPFDEIKGWSFLKNKKDDVVIFKEEDGRIFYDDENSYTTYKNFKGYLEITDKDRDDYNMAKEINNFNI